VNQLTAFLALAAVTAVALWYVRQRATAPRREVAVIDAPAPPAELGRRLLAAGDLGSTLQAVADGLAEALGVERVLLRVYNARTELFEPRAFSGCEPELVHELSNADVTLGQLGGLLGSTPDPVVLLRERIIESSFADRHLCRAYSDGLLLAPFPPTETGPQGYAVVEIPPGSQPHWGDKQVEAFGRLTSMAALAIEAARLRGRLEHKSMELSLASEKLKDLQELKDNFVATVSHELRTPLTSVKAYAEMILRAGDEIELKTVREFTGVIMAESDRLEQVCADVLKISQLESGRAHMVQEDMDFAELVREVADEFSDAIREADLSMALSGVSDVVDIRADRVGLRQVLEHLMDNAIKFTPPAGRIDVRLREGVGVLRVEVEDTGIGIPEREQARIFERFHQVENGSTRPYGGQGLGLTICRDIVRWHGGRIWAESTGENGSRLVMLLPSKGVVIQPSGLRDLGPAERMHREGFLHLLVGFVAETIGAHTTSIMLIDDEHDRLYVEAAVGLADEVVRHVRQRKGEGIAGYVWETNRSLLVQDIEEDARFPGRLNRAQYSDGSLLSVPLLDGDKCIGVINVNNKADGDGFTEEDRLLLEAISERVATALLSYDQYQSHFRRLNVSNAALSAIVDLGRDRGGALRQRLSSIGFETAQALGLQTDELRALAFALRTYDLGLSQVNDDILLKFTPLSPQERASVEEHVRAGAELAKGLELPAPVLKVLVHHHEDFDGGGYPDGLSGEAIPLAARIVRLVDFCRGASSDRPGRAAWSFDEIEKALESGIGAQFCPRVTPIFLRLMREGQDELEAILSSGRAAELVAVGPEEGR